MVIPTFFILLNAHEPKVKQRRPYILVPDYDILASDLVTEYKIKMKCRKGII